MAVAVVVALSLHAYGQEKPEKTLPAVVTDAIKAAYPYAQVMKSRKERKLKYRATVYIVRVRRAKLKDEKARWKQPTYVVVTDKGTVLYASGSARTSDVPLRARIAIKKAAGDGEATALIRYEMFVDEKLVRYEKPRVKYHSLVIFRDSKGNILKSKMPCRVYVAEDGTMVEMKSEIEDTDLPEALIDPATKAADGGTIGRVFKDVTFVNEKMVKLATPRVEYEMWLRKDKKLSRIRFSADGKVIDQIPWH